MTNDWPTKPLVDLVERGEISYGIVQPGSHTDSGTPIVRVKDIKSGRIDTTNPLRTAPGIASRYQRTSLRGGEVLLSLVGSVGQSAVVPESISGWNVARAVAVIKPVYVSASWIHLALQSPDLQNYLSSELNTTVQATLNLSSLKRAPIPIPPEKTREAITEVLGALDDKVAANDRIVAAADQLCAADAAKAVAQSGIPRSLRDVLALEYGKSLPASKRIPGPVLVYGSGGLSGYHSMPLVDRPGVVIGRKGTVGAVYWADGPHFPIDTTYYVEPTRKGTDETLYYILKNMRFDGLNSDSAVPGLNREEAYRQQMRVPRDEILKTSARSLRHRFALMKSVRAESHALARTRDELLPLLMSGKIRVRDAEKTVEEVV